MFKDRWRNLHSGKFKNLITKGIGKIKRPLIRGLKKVKRMIGINNDKAHLRSIVRETGQVKYLIVCLLWGLVDALLVIFESVPLSCLKCIL